MVIKKYQLLESLDKNTRLPNFTLFVYVIDHADIVLVRINSEINNVKCIEVVLEFCIKLLRSAGDFTLL